MVTKQIRKGYVYIQDYVIIFFGTLLYGFGFNGFILSNEIVIGGVSGVSALIFYATNIPVSISYFVINAFLLAFAFKILGYKFLIKTIFGVISLSASLSFFEWLFGGVPLIQGEIFMSIIIGGAICGTGLGLIFAANGSTGGTDILAAIINKYKNVSIGTGLLMFDFVIIASSYILFQDIDKIVYGFVEMGVNNYVLDRIINANRQSVQFLIFSQKYDEITERILKDLGRGCTLLDGVGGYSQKPTKVVVLLAKKSESLTIFRLIKEVDPQAFISQSIVRGVYGEGFDQIKT
ncbi:YitT family protein [Parabacteroides sp. PF5-9]|uniref:YitT family protein n=1 Tax=Parabacteroides sp. PF5-9 TaxID=1742404 RepID=UPI002474B133|nr:YitT family protein [Parabacteroides sp. PF5-9]MDH6356755.1 uncharacterized membrane-anchored protein YitT (DUF2179 family) [Parabacteroides sp. PF5-9]